MIEKAAVLLSLSPLFQFATLTEVGIAENNFALEKNTESWCDREKRGDI